MITQEEIIKKYPSMFVNVDKSPQESCLSFGIECDNGWMGIIDNLCNFLNNSKWSTGINLINKNGENVFIKYEYPTVIFDQIKEKYGTLRIYYHTIIPEFDDYNEISENRDIISKIYNKVDNYVQGAIGFAEFLSSITCEVTGKPGKVRAKGGWLKAVCDEIADKEGYKNLKD
jgi:hypothetical protein